MIDAGYQQPVKYNLTVAREVFKQVDTAERLQPPTLLSSVLGTYATRWGGKVIKSGEWACLGCML